MKRKIVILVVVTFLFSTFWISDGSCQFNPNFPIVGLVNYSGHPFYQNQLNFIILLYSQNANILFGMKKITAENTNLAIDPTLYELPLSPYTYPLLLEWHRTSEFNNQYGTYKVTIERAGLPPQTIISPFAFPQGVVPYPTPKHLRVSFENGLGTPTLSFDPIPGFVPDGTNKFYQIRIYDEDYTRLIYRVRGLLTPQTTFPDGRGCPGLSCQSTAEDLIPGEKYLFRADVWENLPGGGGYIFNSASSYGFFRVPKK